MQASRIMLKFIKLPFWPDPFENYKDQKNPNTSGDVKRFYFTKENKHTVYTMQLPIAVKVFFLVGFKFYFYSTFSNIKIITSSFTPPPTI